MLLLFVRCRLDVRLRQRQVTGDERGDPLQLVVPAHTFQQQGDDLLWRDLALHSLGRIGDESEGAGDGSLQHGRWSGTLMANEGPMEELAGVYAAKWHHTAQGWLLQAEIFTPLTVVRGSTRVERGTDPGVPNGIRTRVAAVK